MIVSACAQYVIKLAISVALLTSVAGCGSGGGGDGGGSSSPSSVNVSAQAADLNARVFAYLQDWYLWYDRLPTPGVNDFSTANYASVEALLDGVRNRPADRFSFVDTVARATALQIEGTATNYGFLTQKSAAGDWTIYYTEPNSPARAAGLARGQQLVAVNGRPMTEVEAAGGIGQALIGGRTAGTRATVRVRSGGIERDISMTSATYALATVWESRLITPTLGYINVKTFSPNRTADDIRAALADPAWNGVTQVIIDVRYNGGGLVTAASALAGSFIGGQFGGQNFARLEFNNKRAGSNINYSLSNSRNPAINVRRAAILATPFTCSASEELIVALRSFVPTAVIATPAGTDGRYTCGKPYGFQPRAFQKVIGVNDPTDPIVYAANFRSIAADGTTDYFDGLAATCTAPDDPAQGLGNASDPMVVTARAWLDTGVCPAGSTPPARAERVAPASASASPAQDIIPPGIGRLIYSW